MYVFKRVKQTTNSKQHVYGAGIYGYGTKDQQNERRNSKQLKKQHSTSRDSHLVLFLYNGI